MAGIQGLDFDENSLTNIDNLFNSKDPTLWVTFEPNDTFIETDYFGIEWDVSPEENWKYFVKTLPELHCRYALVNFNYNKIRKVIFVMWAPEKAPIFKKLQCAMHSLDVKKQVKSCGGIHLSLQANDYSDLDFETVLRKIKQFSSSYNF
jgi:hypothetical protein